MIEWRRTPSLFPSASASKKGRNVCPSRRLAIIKIKGLTPSKRPLSCRRTSDPRELPARRRRDLLRADLSGDGAHAEDSSATLPSFGIPGDRLCTGIKDFRAISANSSLSNVTRVPGSLCLSDFSENTQLNARERCHPSAPSKRVAMRITYDL
jgi:hypothetical protein